MVSLSRALVIDDDDAIRELVRFTLERDGFQVEALPAAPSAFETEVNRRYDVIVLDANLPQVDGFKLIERARAVSRVPILMLTVRHDERDIVRALDLGADDYVTKPFSPRELLARVRTVMHRSHLEENVVLEAGGVRTTVDLLAHRATRLSETQTQVQSLTSSEVALLRVLLRARGRTVPRSALLGALGHFETNRSDRTLDVHICRIRQKIEPCPESFTFIRTVRGVGYLCAPDQERTG